MLQWTYRPMLNEIVQIILEKNCKIRGNTLSYMQFSSVYFLHQDTETSGHPWTSTVQTTIIQKELTILQQNFHFLISRNRVNTVNRSFIIYLFIISG